MAGCEKQRLFVEIPFIGEQTNLMKKKVQHFIGSIRPNLDVRFVGKPPRTVQTFFPTKDPVPKHLQSNTVYAATCKEYGDAYVGMTKRQTVTRLCDHGAPRGTFYQSNATKDPSCDDLIEYETRQQHWPPR